MRPFVFRLAKVRSLRERAEQAAKDELARSLDERARLRQRADDAESRVLSAAAARALEIDPATAELHARYVDRCRQERELARGAAARYEPVVQASVASLHAAALEAETLRRLETRRRTAHQVEALRSETSALDELAVLRSARVTGQESAA
jgi:flagellar export protein FliJ